MDRSIEVRPSGTVFTGVLSDGRHYALRVENHQVRRLYWVGPDLKQRLDDVVLRGSIREPTQSLEGLHLWLALAAEGLTEFTAAGELFSEDSLRPMPCAGATGFDSILYDTNSPFSVKLELTTSCNLRCKHCYVYGARSATLGNGQWIEVLARLRQAGIVRLELTGGEPTLYEGLTDIVRAADAMGFDTTVCTNGVLVDRALTRLLASCRSVDARVSFHSVDEAAWNRFVQTDGTYRRVMDALRLLSDAGARFSVLVVLTSFNEATIHETIAYLEQVGIRFSLSARVFPNLHGQGDNRSYRPSPELISALVEQGYLRQSNAKCSALRTKAWVSCSGDLYPCEMHRDQKVGNVLESSLQGIWRSVTASHFRARASQGFFECSRCEHSLRCGPCPALCGLFRGQASETR